MEDADILRLFDMRSERAIAAAERKYGRQCRALAVRILGSEQDAEECVNDALLHAWNAIPPQQPDSLSAFLYALTRNLALNRLKQNNRLRRGGGQTPAALEELAECIPAPESVEAAYDRITFRETLERFLDTLSADARTVFVQRYWYLHSCCEIAENCRMSEVKVRVTLSRTRKKLKQFLEKEEFL